MPTTIEFYKSRQSNLRGRNTTAERKYKIFGTSDDNVALQQLVATAPATVTVNNGITSILLSEVEYSVEDEDHEVFLGTAQYKYSELSGVSDSTYQFETTAESQHISNSYFTVARYPASSENLNGAINYDGENVGGADILVPTYQFSETHVFTDAAITQAYKAVLFRATGKTNNAPFKGLQAGEVLFLGASGQRRAEDLLWELTFRFNCSPNLTNLSVGNITGITKRGWDLLWVRYDDSIGTQGIIKQPLGVYIERVYDETNMAALNIGT